MTKFSGQNGSEKSGLKSAVVVTVESMPNGSLTKPTTAATRKSVHKKKPMCFHIVALLFVLTGVALAVVGSYYIYQTFNPQGYSTDCRFVLQSPEDSYDSSADYDALTSDPKDQQQQPSYLDEHVEVSDNKDLETITVPKFDDNDEAQFVHDFRQGISLIKDITDGVCYILPLDRDLIPQPATFLDILQGIADNTYILKADMIKSDYEVVQPSLQPLLVEFKYGNHIANTCAGYPTFDLQEVKAEQLTTTTMASYVMERKFYMYPGGQVMMQYTIHR